MGVMLTDDQIDFRAYLAAPEAKETVKPASDWRDRVKRRFAAPDEARGTYLPWEKTRAFLRLRRNELTLWPGVNGHGKSLLLSQVMLCACAQGERVLICSMEMKPELTLERMTRQCTMRRQPEEWAIDAFHDWTEDRLWIYDRLGSVKWENLLAVCRWASDKLGITQIVVDSLMRCGIAEQDYDGQKAFLDALCVFKHDYDVGVHLVMHSRKKADEYDPPGKFDAKGTGTMTDLADNVMTVWRNKRKEAQIEACQAKNEIVPDDLRRQPDAMLICDKQRNFDWEGRVSLWYHRDSMQYVEHGLDVRPMELMEWGA